MTDIVTVSETKASAVVLNEDNFVSTERVRVDVVSVGQQGPQGPQGPIGPAGGSAMSVFAGPAIGGHRIVVLDGAEHAQYADNTDIAGKDKVLGITLAAASAGDALDVLRSGEIVEPSWNWTLNQPVYLGTNGLLTQTAPVSPTAAFSLIVGFPITATKLFISLREPITLN